jgi:hypothetical protein
VAGHRFELGVTSFGDAIRYQIDSAALQTRVSASAPAKFTNADGRTFVAPGADSLESTASLLKFDQTSGTWPIPYSDLVGSNGSTSAYPGAMVVYAAVPLQGLNPSDAASFANVLRFLATTGQQAGNSQGQLPAGYLPLTASNHLGALSAYTVQMADQVQAQTPAVTPASDSSTSGGSSGSSSGSSSGAAISPGASPNSSTTSVAGVEQSKTNPSLSTTGAEAAATPSRAAGVLGLALPAVLVLLLLVIFAYPALGMSAKRRLR